MSDHFGDKSYDPDSLFGFLLFLPLAVLILGGVLIYGAYTDFVVREKPEGGNDEH